MSGIEKEYSAGQIGERVGWVRVTPQVIHDQELVGIDLVAATVTGEDGANFGTQLFHPKSEILTPFAHGFSAVTAFSGIFGNPYVEGYESNLEYSSTAAGPFHTSSAKEILDSGTNGVRFDTLAEKVWTNDGHELIDTLHQLLIDAGHEELYSKMYYWVNGAIGREPGWPKGTVDGLRISDLLLPDATMYPRTVEEHEHARAITALLMQSIENDTEMIGNLNVFSKIASTEIPKTFKDSRERARQLHLDAVAHSGQLAVSRLVYIPVGHGSAGRSWPYMDASEKNAGRAYGRELDGLKEQNVGPAQYELKREASELQGRYDFASTGANRFEFLADQERG
jgi:hypothetical protein